MEIHTIRTHKIGGRFILGGRGRNLWRNRKGLWPLAGARTPLQERAKVARASSCNINVGKPLFFFRIRTARADRNFEKSCRCFSRTQWFLEISACARKKRMCPAWYYLTGMMALAGAQPLSQKFEKVARKSPFDRNV